MNLDIQYAREGRRKARQTGSDPYNGLVIFFLVTVIAMSGLFRRLTILGLGFALLAGLDSAALAQGGRRAGIRRYQNATAEPMISPYLNLIRPGGDPGLNYITLVQPMAQQERSIQQQGRQLQGLDRDFQQQQQAMMTPYGARGGIRPTGGRAATYGNYSHYYPSMAQGGGAGRQPRNYPSPVQSGGGGFGMGGMGMGGMGMGMF